MRKKLWQILVPTVRNDGRPFRLKHHKVWDEKVRQIAGGLTILSPAKGQWVSTCGTLFHERMIPVMVVCNEEDIGRIADLVAKHYDQLAVMYWLVSSEVTVRHYPGVRTAASGTTPSRTASS